MNYFYFELKDGLAIVTETPTNEHAWLWKHDYKNCHNCHISKEEHMMIWKDDVQKRKLVIENGFSFPRYEFLKSRLLGLYKSSDFLLLNTACGKRYSYNLIEGILPDEILDMMADDVLLQKYLIDHYANLYFDPSSVLKSFNAYGHVPMLTHEDTGYRYQIFRLNTLSNREPLFYIEVTCHSHCNRRHYAFRNENLARRFIKDFKSCNLNYCKL